MFTIHWPVVPLVCGVYEEAVFFPQTSTSSKKLEGVGNFEQTNVTLTLFW